MPGSQVAASQEVARLNLSQPRGSQVADKRPGGGQPGSQVVVKRQPGGGQPRDSQETARWRPRGGQVSHEAPAKRQPGSSQDPTTQEAPKRCASSGQPTGSRQWPGGSQEVASLDVVRWQALP